MRARGFSLLAATILAVTMNAHAALPNVTAVATTTNLTRTIVLTQGKTLHYSSLTTNVTAKVNCLALFTGTNPLPVGTTKTTRIYGNATAGGDTYYFSFTSLGPKAAQVVTDLGVTKTAPGAGSCGAFIPRFGAVGLAIYR